MTNLGRVIQHIYDLEPATIFTVRDLITELDEAECSVRNAITKCIVGLSVEKIINTKHYMVLDNIKDVIDNGIVPQREQVHSKIMDIDRLINRLKSDLFSAERTKELMNGK